METADKRADLPLVKVKPDAAALEIRALHVATPGAETGELALVQPVTLSLRAGEILRITGKSGVGKSTLLAMVAGLLPVSYQRPDLLAHFRDSQAA